MMKGILLLKENCVIFVGEKIQETSFDVDTLKNFYVTAIVAD